ncbi:hypothetical protein BLNAU_10192 [Blattamonas nauphoetae]|uniref:Protein kinase domain-containing protein n=1 Tax=Blattamonas nauphoetae TaxID=2049346 RepID=A0ABQ9XTQ3_9EUKA|nr:hypothetical protein BLNAU_10192 [Blattamonas nauphoetae]
MPALLSRNPNHFKIEGNVITRMDFDSNGLPAPFSTVMIDEVLAKTRYVAITILALPQTESSRGVVMFGGIWNDHHIPKSPKGLGFGHNESFALCSFDGLLYRPIPVKKDPSCHPPLQVGDQVVLEVEADSDRAKSRYFVNGQLLKKKPIVQTQLDNQQTHPQKVVLPASRTFTATNFTIIKKCIVFPEIRIYSQPKRTHLDSMPLGKQSGAVRHGGDVSVDIDPFLVTISNSIVATPNPLIGGSFETLHLHSCSFQNVSRRHCDSPVGEESETHQRSLLSGTTISRSENDLYGLLFRDINDNHHHSSINGTFSHNSKTSTTLFRNAAPIADQTFITSRPSTSNDLSFLRCTFTGCTAISGDGGGIYHHSKGSLSVESCQFLTCFAAQGSAIYTCHIANTSTSLILRIVGNSFTACGDKTTHAAIFATQSEKFKVQSPFLVEGCNFTNMDSLSRAGFIIQHLGGGTVRDCLFDNLTVQVAQSAMKVHGANGDVSISDCLCRSQHNYTSGVVAVQFIYGRMTVLRNKFVKCDAQGDGVPSLCLFARSGDGFPSGFVELEEDNPIVSDCWFEAIALDRWADFATHQFVNMQESQVTNHWSTSNPYSIDWIGEAINTIRQTPTIVVDAVSGNDKEFCWMEETGCRTIADAVNTRTANKFQGEFLLKEGRMDETGIEVGERELTMTTANAKPLIVDVGTENTLFSITNGSLSLSSSTLCPHPTSSLFEMSSVGTLVLTDCGVAQTVNKESQLTKALFNLLGGTTHLSSVYVAGLSFLNAAILTLRSSSTVSLSLDQCTFESITRREGNGVVLEASLFAEISVTISKTLVHDCHTLDADYVEYANPSNPTGTPNTVLYRGGTMLIKGSSTSTGTVSVTSSNFTMCSCAQGTGAAIYGCYVDSFEISDCLFSDNTVSGYRAQGGSVNLHDIPTVLISSSSFIRSAIIGKSVLSYGGALSIRYCQSNVSDCLFQDCSAVGNAHALHFTVIENSILSNCAFEECVGTGGYVIHASSIVSWSIQNVSFVACCDQNSEQTVLMNLHATVTSATVTVDQLYAVPDFNSDLTGSIRLDGVLATTPDLVTFSDCAMLSTTPHLLPTPLTATGLGFPTLRVSKATMDGEPKHEDSVLCGRSDKKCRTLRFAVSMCGATKDSSDAITIELEEGLHEENTIEVGSTRIAVCGETDKKSTTKLKSLTDSTLLSVGLGSLSLSSFSIVLQSPQAYMSLISSGGTLEITDVAFVSENSNTPIGPSVLDISGGTASISSCDIPAVLFYPSSKWCSVFDRSSLSVTHLDCDWVSQNVGQFVSTSGSVELAHSSFSNGYLETTLLACYGDMTIDQCSFISLVSSSGPSVLVGTVANKRSVVVTSNTFRSCSSQEFDGKSGVISLSFVTGSTLTIGEQTSIQGCESPSTVSDFLFVSHPTLGRAILEPVLILSQAQDADFVSSFVGQEGAHWPSVPLHLYFVPLESKGYVNAFFSDVSVCGFEMYPCPTVTTALDRLSGCTDPTIELTSTVFHSDTIAFSSDLTLEGNNFSLLLSDSSASFVSSGLFVVSSTITIDQTQFQRNHPFKHGSLFECSSGSLSLMSCRVTHSGKGVDGCVIDLREGASLCIEKSFFVDVVGSHSKAGVIVGTLSESAVFKINDSSFTSCSCSGSANCVWLELKNTSTNTFDYSLTNIVIIAPTTTTTSSPSLNSDSATTDESPNIDVLIIGRQLDNLLSTTEWDGSYTTENEASLWTQDTVTGVSCSLLVYLVPIADMVSVDSKGKNFSKCGHFGLFCETISFGIERLEEADLPELRVVDSIAVDVVVDLKGTHRVSGSSEDSTVMLSGVGKFVNSKKDDVDSFLSVESLVLSVSHPVSHSVFESSSGTISFNTCLFKSTSPIQHSLVCVTGGVLSMIDSKGSDITTEGCSLFESSGSVEMADCSFSTIHRSDKNGSVLCCEISDSVSVQVHRTEFNCCTGGNEDRWIELRGSNLDTFKTTSWSGTFDKETEWSAVMVQRTTDWPHASSFNPFSIIYELHPRPNNTALVSIVEKSADHPLCGSFEAPCSSILGAFSTTKLTTFEIVGSASVTSVIRMEGEPLHVSGYKSHGVLMIEGEGQIVNNVFSYPDELILSSLTLDVRDTALDEDSSILVSENGEVVLKSVVVSSIKPLKCHLLSVSGGKVEVAGLTLTSLSFQTSMFVISTDEAVSIKDIEMKNTSSLTLITTTNVSDLLIEACHFSALTDPPTLSNSPSIDICEWSSGILSLVNTSGSIFSSTFANLHQGGIFVSGGNVLVETSSFRDNTPTDSSSFPSLRRNIRCESGVLNVGSLSGGDGLLPGSSSWMSVSEECVFTSTIVNSDSPLFVPTLLVKNSSVKEDTKKKSFFVELVGEMMIPCGLFLEVFEATNETIGNTKPILLTNDSTTLLSESKITLSFSESAIDLDPKLEWRCRLLHGNSVRTDWMLVKKSLADVRKAQSLETMKWLLPVVGGLVALFVVVLVIVCVLWQKRKRSKAKTTLQSELNEDHQFEDIDKIDILDHTTMNNVQPHQVTTREPDRSLRQSNEKTGDCVVPTEESGVRGGGKWVMGLVLKTDVWTGETDLEEKMVLSVETLFDRLHGKNGRPVVKAQTERELVELVMRLEQSNPTSTHLTRLSPHNVILDGNGRVGLKQGVPNEGVPGPLPNEPPPAPEVNTATQESAGKQTIDTEQEGARWRAPEVLAKKMEVDCEKASVFSLGLVLWEIETGIVPFAEQDVQNAQRLIVAGTRPNVGSIPHLETRELICDCLKDDPLDRPKLEAIHSHFVKQEEEWKQRQPALAEMK